ncbi:RapZ C-terminal domain-containing protein [Nonomuraea typhae]|uniref:RapZ C-terminal domain-containing protein n=1 Tax=Nonomuraea typhae TaxID=2603600 RepID=UPI0012F8FA56|nr:RNase adapter RapZ [Nonomuraea typhae]
MPVPAVDLAETAPVQIISFGYLHDAAPVADITIDARRSLRNPHHNPAMVDLTGLDDVVRQHVLDTPGAPGIIARTANLARGLIEDLQPGRQVTVATGCAGGRHRAVALAEAIAQTLREHGLAVDVDHRDVAKPVVQPR